MSDLESMAAERINGKEICVHAQELRIEFQRTQCHLPSKKVFLEVLYTISYRVQKTGFPQDDGEQPPLSEAITRVVQSALCSFVQDDDVALKAGILFQILVHNNKLHQKDRIFECARAVLRIHGNDFRLQELYRKVMLRCYQVRLDLENRVLLDKDMKRLDDYMTLFAWHEGNTRAPLAAQEIMKCLTNLKAHAIFPQMSLHEQDIYGQCIGRFAMWCLAGSIRKHRGSTWYLDVHVGLEACNVLFRVAAGSMQVDSETLLESDRVWLCCSELEDILVEFRNHLHTLGLPLDKTQWLFERLSRKQAPSTPGAVGAKRSRGEGGAA